MPSLKSNIRPNLAGDYPQIDPTALIDPSAQIIGNVKIEKDVFIGPLTVIRADQRGPDGKVAPIQIDTEVNQIICEEKGIILQFYYFNPPIYLRRFLYEGNNGKNSIYNRRRKWNRSWDGESIYFCGHEGRYC